MVVPSIWPEPFGQVGIEAGFYGMPVVGFDVGGISDWLREGVNGFLAPGDPPRSGELARAVLRCTGDAHQYGNLSAGARSVASEYASDAHLNSILTILKTVAATA